MMSLALMLPITICEVSHEFSIERCVACNMVACDCYNSQLKNIAINTCNSCNQSVCECVAGSANKCETCEKSLCECVNNVQLSDVLCGSCNKTSCECKAIDKVCDCNLSNCICFNNDISCTTYAKYSSDKCTCVNGLIKTAKCSACVLKDNCNSCGLIKKKTCDKISDLCQKGYCVCNGELGGILPMDRDFCECSQEALNKKTCDQTKESCQKGYCVCNGEVVKNTQDCGCNIDCCKCSNNKVSSDKQCCDKHDTILCMCNGGR